MFSQNYTQKIHVTANPPTSFKAVTENVGDWWGDVEGKLTKLDDEFTVSFDETYWTFRATEFSPNTTLVWECVKAHHVHGDLSGIEKEWEGTRVIWNFTETNNGTEIQMTHEGLQPALVCYDVCKEGWDHFFLKSLKEYLDE
ncbi:SRPBCC domain-containing protein [Candidatus Kaiserbacteria bacterium]|nr:SRPBCC domain-containing protein [Candidatus Kaiserbacteria bacterium]